MRADLSRRLEKLAAIIRPTNSLAATVEALSPVERAIYNRWKSACAGWHSQFSTSSGAYEALLEGSEPPELDRRLFEFLHGPRQRFETDATLDQVREAYNLQRENGK